MTLASVTLVRVCQTCGKPMELRRARDKRNQKFCSVGCKNAGYAIRHRAARTCLHCGATYTPVSNVQKRCKICVPDVSAAQRMNRFGLSEPQLQLLLSNQGHQCAICSSPLTRRTAQVDHDHSCCAGLRTCGRCTRGLVCKQCNRGLYFAEQKAWTAAALQYVQAFQ